MSTGAARSTQEQSFAAMMTMVLLKRTNAKVDRDVISRFRSR